MNHACCGEAGGQETRRHTPAPGPADWLALAASPTFAAMALLALVPGGDPARLLCSAAHASPLGGMATMYLLMSAFHMAPWLRLIRARRRPA
jgi:hypothetical protein